MKEFGFSKRGMSMIISMLIIVGIVIVVSTLAFGVVNNLIDEEIEGSEACFGNFNKVNIGSQYTCHDTSKDEVRFLVSVDDLKIDGVLVSLSGASGSSGFKINGSSVSYVMPFNGNYGDALIVPGQNSGKTYVVNLTEIGVPNVDRIRIAPIIGGNQCEVSDELNQIDNCGILT